MRTRNAGADAERASGGEAVVLTVACRAARGYDIRTVQELLGHQDVQTTMISTHVLDAGRRGVRSPFDGIAPRWGEARTTSVR